MMEKCRICLKCRKNLRSLMDAEDGISYLDMITSFTNLKIPLESGIPDKICLACRKKVKEAYDFKISIERSEMILNENANLKRITFNNIRDIKIKIEIEPDCKPLLPLIEKYSEPLFRDGVNSLAYNDTVIKRIKDEKDDCQRKQITVNEFLNSVKMESDSDCDHNYEVDIEYNPDSDSDYKYGKPLKRRKKTNKKNINTKNNLEKAITHPIKPVYLQDLRLVRTEVKQIKRKSTKKKLNSLSKSICPYCGKLLSANSMKSHIFYHTAKKSFKCDQCTKSFYTAGALRNHMQIHTEPRKFKCDQCIATFIYKRSLQSHLESHSDIKKHVCDICKKAFKKKAQLSRHALIHNFGMKPVSCDLCPMTFYTKDALKHHKRVHTGERPFKCELCSQPYSYKHDFNRHCLKKHGIFLKRRSVHIMNEEVLERERALMRNLTLHAHGVIKGEDIVSTFDGPQGAMAYKQAMKAVEARQIPISF